MNGSVCLLEITTQRTWCGESRRRTAYAYTIDRVTCANCRSLFAEANYGETQTNPIV